MNDSFVWQDRGSYPQFIALEASTLAITLPMQFPMLHVDVLYIIKRKKYKTVCAELAFTKSSSTEWSWFCIELIILFLYLLDSWIIAYSECLIKSQLLFIEDNFVLSSRTYSWQVLEWTLNKLQKGNIIVILSCFRYSFNFLHRQNQFYWNTIFATRYLHRLLRYR
jgi:hypothetical protein